MDAWNLVTYHYSTEDGDSREVEDSIHRGKTIEQLHQHWEFLVQRDGLGRAVLVRIELEL